MTRDVLASHRDTGDPRRAAVAAVTALGAALLVVALVVLLVLRPDDPPVQPPPDPPTGDGLGVTFEPAQGPVPAHDPDRAPDPAQGRLDLVLTNAGQEARQVRDVVVHGLGTVLVTVPAGTTVPAGADVRLPATVLPDCGAVLAGDVVVLVDQQYGQDPARIERAGIATEVASPREVLAALCPALVAGLAVTATTAVPDDDGQVLVRLVNHGTRSALVVGSVSRASTAASVVLGAEPSLPFDLPPGEDVVARLRIIVTGCGPAGADPPVVSLEARTPEGYTAVRDRAALGAGVDPVLEPALAGAVGSALAQVCPEAP